MEEGDRGEREKQREEGGEGEREVPNQRIHPKPFKDIQFGKQLPTRNWSQLFAERGADQL